MEAHSDCVSLPDGGTLRWFVSVNAEVLIPVPNRRPLLMEPVGCPYVNRRDVPLPSCAEDVLYDRGNYRVDRHLGAVND